MMEEERREVFFLGLERYMTLFNSWILFGFISLHDILSSLIVCGSFIFFLFFSSPAFLINCFVILCFFMLKRRKRVASIP